MTREEAYKWNENSHDANYSTVKEMEESIHFLLKKIYDNFEVRMEDLKELQENINHSIEEIEWALAKPKYADVYLNNALRFLKERL